MIFKITLFNSKQSLLKMTRVIQWKIIQIIYKSHNNNKYLLLNK